MDRLPEIEQLLSTFLTSMKLSLTTKVTEEDDHIWVELTGPDSYLLLERKASVLEALQLVISKVAESRLGFGKRLVLDCDGFRRGRDAELVESARRAADTVRRQRQAVELAPMNSYERRLVHLALKDESGITARSDGEGPIKKIVISPT